jgi:hypothetical protein
MFYHAALLFDTTGFAQEACALAQRVDRGDLQLLHQRATQIAAATPAALFPLRAYGEPLRQPRPLADVVTNPASNAEIGDWLMIVLSQYVRPCPSSIGFHWQALKLALLERGWTQAECDLLMHGQPLGTLIGKAPVGIQDHIVRHHDPYWRWIRPDYSYTHGGWLGLEQCATFFRRLCARDHELRQSTHAPGGHLQEDLLASAIQGYQAACHMLSAALQAHQGLYMVILWDQPDVGDAHSG